MAAAPEGFPVAVKSVKTDIGGQPTDIISSKYADATLLMITQLGTVGTVIQAKQDATFDGRTTYSTSVLMGRRDEPVLILAARQLVEMACAAGNSKPLIVCLGLKEHSQEAVKQLLGVVEQQQLL